LISQDLYASIVLAVLLSTILAPFLLRYTISRFNRDLETKLIESSEAIASSTNPTKGQELPKVGKTIFYCIQTKSKPAWGIQADIVSALSNLRLDIIDHRSWHPPHSTELLVNEVYVSDMEIQASANMVVEDMEISNRITLLTSTLEGAIQQIGAVVKVQRWFPNIHRGDFTTDRLAREAGIAIERSRHRMNIQADPNIQADSGQEDYVRMEEAAKKSSQDVAAPANAGPAAGDDVAAMDHLDARSKGHLEGLIRHDRLHARTLSYDDGVELLSMSEGSNGYYS